MASSGDQFPASPLDMTTTAAAAIETEELSTPGSLISTKQPYIALVVRKQPPSHVFPEELFHVDFGLDVAKSASRYNTNTTPTSRSPLTGGGVDVEFVVSLWPPPSEDDHCHLMVEPSSIWFSMRGTPPRGKQRVQCQISIRDGALRRDRATSYCLQLSPNNPQSGLSHELELVSTTPITLVNHKIRVEIDSEWESVWYKDEGGRDKSMVVVASLYNRNGAILKGEEVPLQLGLYYNNDGNFPMKVMKQDILRTIGGPKPAIDSSTGRAIIRFRVEDVSKNHQGQDFKIEVAGPSKGFKDVAPGFSPAVNVRSKRNKRQRSAMSSGRPDTNVGSPEVRPSAYDEPTGSESLLAAPELPRLREALKGVIRWADEVVTGMVSLQWQVIGYHQNPDGSPDYNRPYHNIPNPDAVVSRIMGMYADTTREQLMMILHAIDRGSQDHYASLIPPPAIPRGADEEEEEAYTMRSSVPLQRPGVYPPGGMHHPSMMLREQPPGGLYDKPEMRRQDVTNYPHHAMARMQTTEGLHPHTGMRSQHQHLPMHPDPLHQQHLALSRMAASPNPTAGYYHHQHQYHAAAAAAASNAIAAGSSFRESEVAYVLAKQFKSVRTGDRLGFPAYSRLGKELLGFYRESGVGVAQFVPIQRHAQDFGPMELRMP
ncbi:hypothetical protein MHU86_14794 [Fragilaria crotonensis]|nr:hypothetical protein MHU86_14794 [Fragilaria crotonensis]